VYALAMGHPPDVIVTKVNELVDIATAIAAADDTD
jgi:hypothetical protein